MCLLDHVPFTHRRIGEEEFVVDTKSIIQSLLTAAITAAITGVIVMYGAMESVTVQVKEVRQDVSDIKQSVNEIRHDFYKPNHYMKHDHRNSFDDGIE